MSHNTIAYRSGFDAARELDMPDDWIVEPSTYDFAGFHAHDLSVSPVLSMRRYMNEHDCILFSAPIQPDTASLPPFQSLDIAPYAHPTSARWTYGFAPELPSPSMSGPGSTYFSSSASDRQSTPMSPPDDARLTWSPEIAHAHHFGLAFGGGHDLFGSQKHKTNYPCVTMTDVQTYEDTQPDNVIYDEDTAHYETYASAPHEGYQPLEPDEDTAESGVETDVNDAKDDDYTPRAPHLRRRRPQPTRSVTSQRTPARVTKRSGHARRSSAPQAKAPTSTATGSSPGLPNRAFACALAQYGCESTFGSKNEWKRHVNTQHMRLGYWRCDQCDSNKKPNDFNRKDLFIQHVRRMHPVEAIPTPKKSAKQTGKTVRGSAEEHTLNTMAERCLQQDRSPPSKSGCHFCTTIFEDNGEGPATLWDKRLEHIAQHMETEKKAANPAADPSRWHFDARFERWLVNNGIVVEGSHGGYTLA